MPGEEGYPSSDEDDLDLPPDFVPPPPPSRAHRTHLGVYPGQFRLPPRDQQAAPPPGEDEAPGEDGQSDSVPGLVRADLWAMGLVFDGTEDDFPGTTRRGSDVRHGVSRAARIQFERAERAVAARERQRVEGAATRPRTESDSTADSMPPLMYCSGVGNNNGDNNRAGEEEDAEAEVRE